MTICNIQAHLSLRTRLSDLRSNIEEPNMSGSLILLILGSLISSRGAFFLATVYSFNFKENGVGMLYTVAQGHGGKMFLCYLYFQRPAWSSLGCVSSSSLF